jgi:hypothetical protein
VQTNRSEIARAALKRAYRKPLYTPGGIYLGSPIAVPVDRRRLELSFERMVRGLYYHVWNDHLPRDYTFELARIDGFHTAAVWSEMRNTILIEVLTLPPNGIEALIAEESDPVSGLALPNSDTGMGAGAP